MRFTPPQYGNQNRERFVVYAQRSDAGVQSAFRGKRRGLSLLNQLNWFGIVNSFRELT